ncbi:ATP-binding protein [Streptomyces niger]|uniref:ATP-binding protein n=1 Tax=Streptomyces niger TaxID=66373 RepID=UPI00069B4CEB|nr:LuxR C-terminal-related transcriptional regulator [Streptomyces niger]
MGGSGARRTVGFPAEATSFVGRRRELAEARRLLSTARLLTLIGPGGVGKTRLAEHLAKQVERAFCGGVWMVSLAGVQSSALIPHAVVDSLDIHDETGRPPEDVLVEHLRSRQLLLVLDNCEHVLGACALLIRDILSAAEGVRVLATSRHRLRLTEEHLLAVEPLPTPARETPAHAADTSRFPALQLFADRATAVAPDFEITDENRAAVVRVCRRLDGLPLAIELAAVRLHALGVEQLDERLDDQFRLLTAGSPAAPRRHQTLRSAVDWSFDLCTPREQLAWARLSVLVDSFDLCAAESVCPGAGLDRSEVLDSVAGLVEKSILARENAGGAVRYRMLALVREYGRQRLKLMGENVAVQRLHRDHFLRLAEAFERQWFGPGQSVIVARLRAERGNLRAALEFCLTSPDEIGYGRQLMRALWFYWAERGALAEMRHWWRRIGLQENRKAISAAAKSVWLAGLLSVIHSRSAAVLQSGIPPRQEPPSEGTPGFDSLAVVAAREDGGERELCFHVLSRVEIACTLVFRGVPEHALPLCEEALAVCEAYSEQWVRSYVLCTLATAHWALGDHQRAARYARQCLRLDYVSQEPRAVGRTVELLAAVAADQGETERAAVLQGAAHHMRRDVRGEPVDRHREEQSVGPEQRDERDTDQALDAPVRDRGRAYRSGQEKSLQETIEYALCALPESANGRTAPAPGRRPDAVPSDRTASDVSTVLSTASEAGLTPRECEVAGLIAQGLTNRQIAETLVISRRTAEGHVERILGKLGFTTRSQVAVWVSERTRVSGSGKPPEQR